MKALKVIGTFIILTLALDSFAQEGCFMSEGSQFCVGDKVGVLHQVYHDEEIMEHFSQGVISEFTSDDPYDHFSLKVEKNNGSREGSTRTRIILNQETRVFHRKQSNNSGQITEYVDIYDGDEGPVQVLASFDGLAKIRRPHANLGNYALWRGRRMTTPCQLSGTISGHSAYVADDFEIVYVSSREASTCD